jgi:hypothetical protein
MVISQPNNLTVGCYDLRYIASRANSTILFMALLKLPVDFKYAYMPRGEAGKGRQPSPVSAPLPHWYRMYTDVFLRGRGRGWETLQFLFLSKGQG